jgi:hypothetical protein
MSNPDFIPKNNEKFAKWIIILFAGFSLFLLPFKIPAQPKSVYLSPSGDNNNAGTKEKPLASLNGAHDKIRKLRLKENIRDTSL